MIKTPKPTSSDRVHAVVKAGISALPVVGGPASELFQLLVSPPLEQRRNEWMEEVGAKLQELEKGGLDLAGLQENEQFITAVMKASSAAVRTHQREKLNALRNAIANIATGRSPDDTELDIILRFLDDLTEMHFRLIEFARSPNPPNWRNTGALASLLEEKIPPLSGRRDLYDLLWKDLYSRGLVNVESLHGKMTGNGLSQSRTTSLGDSLLRLICDPDR